MSLVELMIHALQTWQFWLTSLLAVCLLHYLKNWKYNLPPRPHGWPIIGNTLAVPFIDLHRWCQQVSKLHGPVFRITLGFEDVVVINNIEHAHKALVEKSMDFSGRPSSLLFDIATEGFQDVALADPDSPSWPQRRKLLSTALRNFTSGKNFEQRIFDSFSSWIKLLDEHADKCEPFNPRELCRLYLFNQMATMCFSVKYTMDDPELQKLGEVFDDFTQYFGGKPLIGDAVPFLYYLPFDLPDARNFRKINVWMFEYCQRYIEEHRKTYTGVEVNDLLYYLFKTKAEDSNLSQISEVQLRQLVIDVFAAGVDTSQMTLRWLLLFLADNQDVQDKLYDEIVQVIGENHEHDTNVVISCSEYKSKMPYSEAVLLESIRLGTVAILGLPRKTMKDTKIGEWDIPKGTTVMINQYAVNHDDSEMEEPNEFKPERFLKDGGLGPRPTSFMAFGAGRRACPGETASRNALWMTMIMLLRRYLILPQCAGEKMKTNFTHSNFFGETGPYEIRLKYRK